MKYSGRPAKIGMEVVRVAAWLIEMKQSMSAFKRIVLVLPGVTVDEALEAEIASFTVFSGLPYILSMIVFSFFFIV
jgi:hypothetical protein